jgi:hypothetical protein
MEASASVAIELDEEMFAFYYERSSNNSSATNIVANEMWSETTL